MNRRILLVANPGAEHVGAHLLSAAREMGLDVRMHNMENAYRAPRFIRSFNWWLRGRLPSRLKDFSQEIVEASRDFRPTHVITTGIAPISAAALDEIRGAVSGEPARLVNFLTDDPWNRAHLAPWFFEALTHYDTVFSPRRDVIGDLQAHGCRRVDYLPFAYSPEVHFPEAPPQPLVDHDVVFIGGGDPDRQKPVRALIDAGIRVALYGGYWDRDPRTRPFARGFVGPRELRWVTGASKVVLGLIRRANRDGHSMRTFEAPAMHACLLTEDTFEHREIFGEEGECVLYFCHHAEMIEKAHRLLGDASLRERLSAAAHAKITGGGNTYRHRLTTMIG